MSAKRGRPRKQRPVLGTPVADLSQASQRDLETALGIPRHRIQRAIAIASLPEAQFERLLAKPRVASPRRFELLARRGTGKSVRVIRRCPHCGKALQIEGEQLEGSA
jgi:hypothetical protein